MMNNNLAMEDNFGCSWNYEETIEALKVRVLVLSYELESTQKQADEERKKNEDGLRELLNHLQTAHKERDEARHQLHTLLNNHYSKTTATITTPPPKTTTNDQHFLNNNNNNYSPNPKTTATPLSPQSPLPTMMTPTSNNTKTSAATAAAAAATGVCNNSSNSASDSPSIDSFFDTPVVSFSDFSTFNPAVVDSTTDHLNTTTNTLNFSQQPLIPDLSSSLPSFSPAPPISPDAPTINQPVDQASLIISSLAKGRPLPQKGRLLQAVMEAGPLLQTLMVAGPLPRWRNPPPVQPLHIPPFQIAGSTFLTSNIDNATTTDTSSSILLSGRGFNSQCLTTKSAPPAAKRPYDSMIISSGNVSSRGGSSTQLYNNSNMLNFGGLNGDSSMAGLNTVAGGCAGGRMMMSGSSRLDNLLINNQNLSSIPKRQRIL